jgi:hypothetical protein
MLQEHILKVGVQNMAFYKWLLIMVMNLLGFLTAPIMFPIAYLLRNVRIVRDYILWIYYDDEDEYGFDVHWFKPKMDDGFIKAYLWAAIRNPAWNLHTLNMLNGSAGNYIFLKPRGSLQRNGKILEPSLKNTAVLKYVSEDGTYMDNKGKILSLKYSVIGSQYVTFYNSTNNKKYWRFSYANKVIDNLWVELHIGFTTRATFRLKFKIIKEII